MKTLTLWAAIGLTALSTLSAEAAPARKTAGAVAARNAALATKPYIKAKDGTTDIADCGKADPAFRNECISRARPVTGKQIYATLAAKKAAQLKQDTLAAAKSDKQAKVAKVAAASGKVAAAKSKAPKMVAKIDLPKGFKVAKDGTTFIGDCAKAIATMRNECISRARPLKGKELVKFEKSRQATTTKVKADPKAAAPKKKSAAVSACCSGEHANAVVPAKSFPIAADGTTNVAHCAKATSFDRNECISRSRPISGATLTKLSSAQ